MQSNITSERLYFDATELKCPLLFVRVKQHLKKLKPHQQLKVDVNDKLGLVDITRYLQKHQFEFSLSPVDEEQTTIIITAKES